MFRMTLIPKGGLYIFLAIINSLVTAVLRSRQWCFALQQFDTVIETAVGIVTIRTSSEMRLIGKGGRPVPGFTAGVAKYILGGLVFF